MLEESDAIKIYQFMVDWKIQAHKGLKGRSFRGQSEPVSKLFGVSSRTVRDIWNRRTWVFATKHLWACEPKELKLMVLELIT